MTVTPFDFFPKPASGDTPPLQSAYEALDSEVHATIAKATSGLAPSVLGEAWMDWAVHLAVSPGKQWQLADEAMRNLQALWAGAMHPLAIDDTPDTEKSARPDRRFAGAGWQKYPFNILAQAHQMNWAWWQQATRDVHGVDKSHEDLMAFVVGQIVDMTAPSNFLLTNPDVLAATEAEHGMNLIRGANFLTKDVLRKLSGAHDDTARGGFSVGTDLAVTPGKVVYRNDLIELIQYAPTTGAVHPEPILIVPAWIMKYYILDLSSHNSLVRYLVSQGFTVFMISWKNPTAEDRDLGMDDYRKLGVMAAIDAALAITGQDRLHAVGYCLGGTLLSIAAAAMGRDQDPRLASATFFATQVDFTEAGGLRLFINESEVTLIEDMMSVPGYLSSAQMAGAFALLRARDLIWAPAIRDYMLGQRARSSDLMSWNVDATRMPYRMHSQYLRRLFLNNDLASGRYEVDGAAIAIRDIRAPIFAVGTEDDHVAPWPSVYKFHLLSDTDVTFVLTSGGHNAGIVSEPGHKRRHFRIATTLADAPFREPADWEAATEPQEGSWWTAFVPWLKQHSSAVADPPPMGQPDGPYAVIGDAPGTYVMQE